MTAILFFVMCSAVYAAAPAGAPAAAPSAAPSGIAGGADVAAPSSGGDIFGAPSATGTGGDIFGAPADVTGGMTGFEAPTSTAPSEGTVAAPSADGGASAADVEGLFNNIIFSGRRGNAMSELMRRLPRYGMSFFRQPPSTYAPQESAPVTAGYRIAVGDQMSLTIWGIPEEGSFPIIVNRDGMAVIPRIGSVRLAGYTLAEAERILSSRLNQYYTGFQMNLSMGRLSSIMVYVTGNVNQPGAYTISSFSTLINALLASGGPNDKGTLRKIEVKRDGRTIAVFDMYAMLLQGDNTQDIRLQAGDVIYVPPVGPLVGITGEIQRPGVYELNGATRVKDLLFIAGGLNAQTFKGRIQYYRIFDSVYATAFEGNLANLEDTLLQDGDILRLFPIHNLSMTATITGPVMNPGVFVITPGVTKLSQVVNRAGGLLSTASDRAEITRVTPSLEGPVQERFNVNLFQALQGDPVNDIALEFNDHITILTIPNWKTQFPATITGEVRNPGTYSMFEGERISDLIQRAGGFTPKAFLRGAMFTRQSVAAEQRKSLNRMADQMERDLLQAMQNTASSRASTTAVSTGTADFYDAEYKRRKELIDSLRNIDIMGRIVTKIDTPQNLVGTVWDYELQPYDSLTIPDVPVVVNVLGAVYSSSTHVYNPDRSINAYINASGGALRNAHKRLLYLLKADGTTIRLTRSTAALTSKAWKAPSGFSAKVEPGDTIVVPVKYLDRQSIESVKDVVDIVYKVAVGVGVILDAKKD